MAEQTTPTQGVEQGAALSVEQRLANLYGAKMEAPADDPPAPEEAPETGPAPEAAEQGDSQADELSADDLPDDGEQAAQQSLDEWDIVHNGTQHKLPRDKVIELAQKGFDYTAKTQALASQQRATMELMQRVQELEALAPEVTNELAQVRAAERALAQWQNVDWIQLATNDPLEYPKYRAQFDQLREAYSMAANAYNQKAGALQQRKAEVSKAVVQQEMSRLQEIMPQLRDPKAFQAAAAEIKSAALADGYSEQEVDQVVDARYVRTLWKAAQYDKLVKSKAEKIKQARAAPPTAKPGAAGQTQSAEAKRMQETRKALKKTGDWRDAASLLARLK
jgi:hypothetical protein